MPRVLVIGELPDRMRTRLEPHAEIVTGAPGEMPADAILLAGHARIDAGVLDAVEGLQIVSNYGVGYDTIDAEAAAARGIVVTHTPDVLNEDVATTAVLLMLAGYRRLLRDDAYLRAGRWEAEGAPRLTRTTERRRVGILGLGRIGQEIARKLEVFDAEIAYHGRTRKDVPYRYYADLEQMARDVEVLVVVTPGGDATRHLVDADVLSALGSDGMLVNVARGSVVDETALIAALREGRLGFAALDVFEDEPRVPHALREMENTLLLPHVGSATVETRAAMGDLAVDNLIAFFEKGRAKTPVPECRSLGETSDAAERA